MRILRPSIASPRRRQDLFAILLAIWLLGCTAFQFHPRTAFGVQCPTAPVQTVQIAIRDCCGNFIGFREVAPAPGEASFVQCLCAEKKVNLEVALPPKLEPFFLPESSLDLPEPLPAITSIPAYQAHGSHVEIPPLLPPPDLA